MPTILDEINYYNGLDDPVQAYVFRKERGDDWLRWAVRLAEAAERATQKPDEVQAIMRKHGFVIDDLDDRWQKFAFTLYTDIVTVAEELRRILSEESEAADG